MVNVVVAGGDCIERIANANGYADYLTIWNDGSNSGLKTGGRTPNHLALNDTVELPDTKTKTADRKTGKLYVIVVKVPKQTRLRIVLLDDDEKPRRGCAWTLSGAIAGNGTTGSSGLIEVKISPAPDTATLELDLKKAPSKAAKAETDPPDPPTKSKAVVYPPRVDHRQFTDTRPGVEPPAKVSFGLKIGWLGPPSDNAGLQARLQNLGFQVDPGVSDAAATKTAVEFYQRRYKQTVTGVSDDVRADVRHRHDDP
jgi:hypothetical protein